MSGLAVLKAHSGRLRRAQLLRYAGYCLPVAAVVLLATVSRGVAQATLYATAMWLLTVIVLDLSMHRTRVTRKRMTMWLDREYPALEDSTSLLLQKSHTLNAVASIQRTRIQDTLAGLDQALADRLSSRAQWLPALAVGLLGVALVVNMPQLWQFITRSHTLPAVSGLANPIVHSVRYDIEPPAYMNTAVYSEHSADIDVPVGSKVRVTAVISQTDSVYWQDSASQQQHRLYGSENNFYQSDWWSVAETTYQIIGDRSALAFSDGSQVHRIAVIDDQLPHIEIVQPVSRVHTVVASTSPPINVQLNVTDDYGVNTVVAQVTRSVGDGEQVRFEKQDYTVFTRQEQVTRGQTLHYELDAIALGLTQGSELYVSFMVSDNREPTSQQTESTTLIVRWPAPETTTGAVLDNQIIDVLPEYFRSQRQIIIDTEQLLKEVNDISAAAFASRAQTLAFDQRALRLRYGTFMGEEDSGEPAAGASELGESEGHFAGDGHDHDDDDFVAASQAANAPAFGDVAGAIEPYAHFHDQEEQATIFDPQTRGLLRQALSAMWRSEGTLRLHTPAQSLPHQYRALALIKQVQNRSRVFVERIGFEPRAIDLERRLTGELDDLADQRLLIEQREESAPSSGADVSAQMLTLLSSDTVTADAAVIDVLQWLAGRRQTDKNLSDDDKSDFLDAEATLQNWRQHETCASCRRSLSGFWRRHAPSPASLPARRERHADVFAPLDGGMQ